MRQTPASLLSAFCQTAKATLVALTVLSLGAVAAQAASNPRYAAIVVDANTGKTLYSSSADGSRYPASLTKMMTLYLVFDALKAGRIRLDSRVPFSKYAAARPPTKIGIRPGGSVTVEEAVLSLITKSANDAAAALGELIGGTEANFARMMTAKARSLGMDNTTFRNASGLPDPNQRTTARDMATLGIALREHHAKYYPYFSTTSFKLGKQTINGHNRLLGRIKGVDGIKTGYVNASGFNLVTSVKDGDRKLVAVVMGGTSGAARDNQMAQLIKTYLPKASTRSTGLLVARGNTDEPVVQAYAAALPHTDAPMPIDRPGASVVEQVLAEAKVKPDLQVASVETEKTARLKESVARSAAVVAASIDPVATASTSSVASIQANTNSRSAGWAIQVASLTSAGEAQSTLTRIASKATGILSADAAFTETFTKGGTTYYRARFGGYGSKDEAWETCSALKKKQIPCYAIEQ
ncbi:D-alanyl-D-alanine carboxypeptidase [Tianweitania sp.]|uniref:D-alanyl-D-alanine carboxypeptidase n=1 Tax=Tianweitania sp. TaxID=2021634 RepID=UPI002897EA27|nr:D-alanyl-D-alanine carboxypeptidase [Tianweitania sp.]